MNEVIQKQPRIQKWQALMISLLAILVFMQSSREILLDRGIALVVLGIVGAMLLTALLTGLLSKYISNLIILVIAVSICGIGRILLSMPDNTDTYQVYNLGLYFCVSTFAPIFISLFGLINEDRLVASDETSNLQMDLSVEFVGIAGILIGLIYHWTFRAIGYAEDVILNVFIGIFLIVIGILILYGNIIKTQFEKKKLTVLFKRLKGRSEMLQTDEHPGRKHKYVLIGVPCFVVLTTSMSFPELYAYMSGSSYQLTLIMLIIGIITAIILTSIRIKNSKIKEVIDLILPAFSLITAFVFGLISFYPSEIWVYNIVYLIASFTVGYIFLNTLYDFIISGSNDAEKILMVFILFGMFGIQGVKLGTIERYLPYLECLICLGFAIPAIFLWIKQFQKRRKK